MENPYETFPKPHMDVQFSPQGPWILWDTENNTRTGLVLHPRACQDAQCDCREMTLDCVAVVADNLICASVKPEGLQIKCYEAYTPSDTDSATGVVKVHIDTGEIIHERSRAHARILQQLHKRLNGVFLEHLHQRWLTQKGLSHTFIPESLQGVVEAGSKAMLPWEHFFAYGRDDIYIVHNKAYWVVDYHCVTLSCDCEQVRLVVLDASSHTDTALGCCIVLNPTSTEPVLEGPSEHHALLREIWGHFLARHQNTHFLYQRRSQVREALEHPPV